MSKLEFCRDSVDVAKGALESIQEGDKNFINEVKCLKSSGGNAEGYAKCMLEKDEIRRVEERRLFHRSVFNANQFFLCYEASKGNKSEEEKCSNEMKSQQKLLVREALSKIFK